MNRTAIIIAVIIVVGVVIVLSAVIAVCVILGVAKYEKESLKNREVELQKHRPYPERIQKVRDEIERDKK